MRRIGYTGSPFKPSFVAAGDLESPDRGNRWDSQRGNFGVLYFGSTWACSFGEVLQALRPTTKMIDVVTPEWSDLGFMVCGKVEAAWRHRRIAVSVNIHDPRPFVDVEHSDTHEVLTQRMARIFAALGVARLDVSTVRGADRRVTRSIAQWIHDQEDDLGNRLYAGVRYLSKIDTDWECWAVFDDTGWEEAEAPRPIQPDDVDLVRIRDRYRLSVY
uniref:RES family NAD+ phosphorylase n=1 Tax=Streptomyces sp. 44030 TaxID=364102 RepID=UPI0015673007|nr:RES family NAD+ phosphorylase [Streptomyces sp. 44030]